MALAEGRTTREGRVDVFYQGRWGAVCQTGMGHAEADAVCRFLGHKGGIWAGDQPVGRGSGHHWQLNMTCLMSPQQLLCPLVLDTGNNTVVECGEGGFTVVCGTDSWLDCCVLFFVLFFFVLFCFVRVFCLFITPLVPLALRRFNWVVFL